MLLKELIVSVSWWNACGARNCGERVQGMMAQVGLRITRFGMMMRVKEFEGTGRAISVWKGAWMQLGRCLGIDLTGSN
jgi:hypothetical protein